jgi:O-antigen ligase
MVKDSPITGKGLLGFSNNWYAYNTDPGLEHYPAPHNIALNFWIDTGLLGLISFFGLLVLAVIRGIKERSNAYKLGLLLACVALVMHGLVDIPYFKNDLALLFWMLYSFI